MRREAKQKWREIFMFLGLMLGTFSTLILMRDEMLSNKGSDIEFVYAFGLITSLIALILFAIFSIAGLQSVVNQD